MKLTGYSLFNATIRLKSPLHIGTGERDIEKGEPTPIIKSKSTGLPYLPGSSLKGKMRHLFEIRVGRQETDPRDVGSSCWCGKCQICLLFGSGNTKTTYEPSRLIFRDCHLTDASAEIVEKIGTENKPGVRIDRNTGKAAGGALFPMERLPEGAEFNLEISVRVFENDDKSAILKWLEGGFLLLESDALGGGGTRGSGWIEIKNFLFDGQKIDQWREEAKQNIDKLIKIGIKR